MFRIVEPEVALVELGRAPVEPRAGPGSVVVPLEPLVISGIQWTKTLVLQRLLSGICGHLTNQGHQGKYVLGRKS